MSKLKKRLLALGLVFVMIVTIIPSSIYAENETTSSGTEAATETSANLLGATLTATDKIQDTIDGAETGSTITITLTKNYTEDLEIIDGVSVILDLNGYTITSAGTNKNAITVYGTLTIKDSSEDTNGEGYGTGTLENGGTITNTRGVIVAQGGSFTFESGTITGFSVSGNGGGVLVENGGTFAMTGGTITNNSATVYGGGVFLYDADQVADITGGTISDNEAGISGGGLAANTASNSTLTLNEGLTIYNNTAAKNGGGVYFNTALDTLTISSTITKNTATSGMGGGVYFGASVSTLNIQNATIDYNTAGDAGGGAYFAVAVTSATISGSSLSNNNAGGNGGGIWLNAGTSLTFGTSTDDTSKINKNTISAAGALFGGGIYLYSTSGSRSTFVSTGGEISGNKIDSTDSTNSYGGGISIGSTAAHAYASVNMTGTTISDNKGATYGGGIAIYTYAQEATFTNLTVSGNEASASAASGTGYGGGVYIAGNSACVVTVSGGIYSENEADYYGGGIYVTTATSSLVLQDAAKIDGNTSYNGGGGIYTEGYLTLAGGDSKDTAIQICNNAATGGVGGGVYSSTSNSYAITSTGYVDVYENSAGTNGGGLCVNAGGMDLSGNITIHNNYSKGTNYGGAGLYAGSNTTGTIWLHGGVEIYDNKSNLHGGGVYARYGLKIDDGVEIHDNYANSNGGGVDALTLEMTGGKIYDNSAANGGGVYIVQGSSVATDLESVISGGEISNNTARTGSGGGVYENSYPNQLYIKGTVKICYNTAYSYGGGVYASDLFGFSGGIITGNTAQRGGGVYLVGYYGQSATIEIASASSGIIYDNTATAVNYGNDLALGYSATDIDEKDTYGRINATAAMTVGAASTFTDTENKITGVSWYDEVGDSTETTSFETTSTSSTQLEGQYFTLVYEKTTGVEVAEVYNKDLNDYEIFPSVQAAVNAIEGDTGKTTYCNSDGSTDSIEIIMLADSREDVDIPGGLTVTLDLAGCTLTGLKKSVITVEKEADLTIVDTSAEGTGLITGGDGTYYNYNDKNYNYCGGGLLILGNATFKSGTISGNTAAIGGGVFVAGKNDTTDPDNTFSGTFTLAGGTITGNTATSNGGGLSVYSGYTSTTYKNATTPNFTMTSGYITANKGGSGGGVYIYVYVNVEITGGSITNNTCSSSSSMGGGMYIYSQTLLNMTGGEITGNTAVTGGGIYSSNINSNLTFSNAAQIYDNTATSNVANDIYATITGGSISVLDASSMDDASYNSWFDSNADGSDDFPYYYTSSLYYKSSTNTNHIFALTATNYTGGYVAYIPDDNSTDTVYQIATTDSENGSTNYSYTMNKDTADAAKDAGEDVKEAKGTAYETLQAAINAAVTGDTIYLLCDVSESLSISGLATRTKFTIDLNGYTVYSTGDYGFYIKYANTVSMDITIQSDTTNNVFKNTESGAVGTITVADSNSSSFPWGIYIPSGNTSYQTYLTVDSVLITGFGNVEQADASGSSTYNGAGIYTSSYNSVTLTGTTKISGNYAYQGGGVYMTGYNIYLTMGDGVVVSGNTAYQGGGVCFNASGDNTGTADTETEEINIGQAEISGNTSANVAGGLYIIGWNSTSNTSDKKWPEVTIDGATIEENTAGTEVGGAYFLRVSKVTITNSYITDNYSTTQYGGMYVNASGNPGANALYTITNSYFTGNKSGTGYAGLIVGTGVAKISNCTFTKNTSATGCAALYLNTVASGSTLSNCTFTNNESTTSGYIVYATSSKVDISNMTVTGNTTSTNTGAVCLHANSDTIQGEVTITESNISNNTGYGLDLYLQNDIGEIVTVSGTTITGNAGYGIYMRQSNNHYNVRSGYILNIEEGTEIHNNGNTGIYANGYGTLNINGGKIYGNTGSAYGGGVHAEYTDFNMSGGEIYNNTATKGGGVYLYETENTYYGKTTGSGTSAVTYGVAATDTITGGKIYNNTSTVTTDSGGGIYVGAYDKLLMTGGTVTSNTAGGQGGGVYVANNYSSFELGTGTDTSSGEETVGQVYGNTALLGQDVYAEYSQSSINTTLTLIKAEDMFDDDSGMTGIGWLNESTSAVTTTAIDYDPIKKAYPLTLEYETNTVVAVIWNNNEEKYDTFYSVQEAVDALLADKTGGNGDYYTGSITSPEIILVDDSVGNVDISGVLTLTLNLNGYTLKGSTTAITCYGTLTIKDVQYSGTATPGDADNYCEHYDELVSANQAVHDNNTSLGAGKGTSYTGTITGTSATLGGGIYVCTGGYVTMISGQIANCSAGGTTKNNYSYGGAGVYIESGTFVLSGTASINNCSTKSYGSAVYLNSTSGTFILEEDAVITGNSSYYGTVYIRSGTFNMTGGTITGNTAEGNIDSNTNTGQGGGIYVYGGTVKLTGGEISDNTATGKGGGIYINSGTVTLSGSIEVTGNSVTGTSTTDASVGGGGGIYVNSGTLNIKTGVEITGNTAIRGGGIYQYNGTINMSGGQITGNTAEYGGGLVQYPTQSGKFTMTGGVLCDNTSSLGSAGNDVYSVKESGSYTYTGSSYPTATLIRAADMDYTSEGYSASYNVWKDDTYDGTVRTGEHIGDGQYITAKITTSTGLMLTADKYKETAATVETTTTFYTNAISVSSIADGVSSYWDSNGVTAYKDAKTGESTADTWDYTSSENPLAATWTAGDDNNNKNGLVRTYDRITYKLNITYQDSDGEDDEAETILLYVEATLPLTTTEAEFYTSNLTDYVIEESDDGTYSTITGYLEVDAEAGNQDVTIGINVKGMNNGDLVEPTFKTWIDGNSSNEDDPKELTPTAITVSAAGVYDLTLLRNEQLAYTGYFDLSTGEETTKKAYEEAEAAGNNTTIVYGTMLGYGITLSMRNYNTAKGKMGMATPVGDIEFDLTLTGSLYINNSVVTDINGDQVYAAPYVWAYKANENTETGSNLGNTEKNINMNWNDEDDTNSTTQYAYNAAPFNTGGNNTSCYSGGAWTATGSQPSSNAEETTVHFTVSGYTIDTTYSSTTPNAASDGTTDNFTGSSIKPFSAGYIQVIFPIDTDTVSGTSGYLSVGMESIVSGLNISDSSGKVTGRDVSDETDGDLASIIAWYGSPDYKLYATGEQYYLNNYVTAQTGLYVSSGDGESLIKTNYFNNSSIGTLTSDKGTGTTSLGSVVYMGSDVTFSSNTYDTTDSTSVHYNAYYNAQTDNAIEYDYMTAMNLLQKFDADAYTPASTTLEVVNETYTLTSQTNDIKDGSGNVIFRIKTSEAAASWSTTKTMSYTLTILYAAKPNGKNWEYSTYMGYETPTPEMDDATEEDLIYFTTLHDLYDYFGDSDGDGVSDGVCVGILYEFRDCCIRSGKSISAMARLDVTNDFEAAGNTYCITNDARCWTTYRPVYKDAIDTTTSTSLSDMLFDFTWFGVDYDDSKNTSVNVYGTADGSLPASYYTAYTKYSSSSGGYTYDSSSKAKLETYNPGYVKTEYVNGWQDTTTPTHSGWYQGNTLLLYTMESSIDIDGNDYDAGSNVPKSTYKIGTERTASFVVTPKLTESSSVSNELVSNGTQATEVVITISLPNHLNYDENSITFDYSASDCGYEEGELEWTIVYTESDAAVGETGYGTATIVLTTSVADISKVLPTIKYTCTIGDPTVADGHADEVSNGETLTTTATINTAYEESGQISTYAKKDTYTISVIKSAGDNIWIVGSGLLELGESMEFDVYYKNGSTSYRSIEIGNVLPYNGDGRGTVFTGGYQVTELTLTFSSYETLEKFLENGVLVFDNEATYSDVTTEMDALMDELLATGYVLYEGSGAETALKATVSDAEVVASSDYYTVDESAYTITFDLTALSAELQEILTQLATDDSGIAFYAYLDNVAEGEIVEMAYTLSPSVTTGGVTSLIADEEGNVQTGQNTYAESVSYRVAGETTGSVTSVLKTVSNVNRVLSGIAWLDQDNDGFYSTGSESTDEILQGIDVYLYSATPTDAQEYYNDSTVTVNKDADDNITSCEQTISDGNGGSTTITLYPTTVTVSDGAGGTTEVTLYPAVSVEGNLYNAVVTDENGAYSFEYLAPGTYWVVFKDDTDNGKDEYTVDDTGTTPIPFGNLSVTAISSAAATSTGAYNRASASYGSGESTSTSPASLVLGYISGIEMPEASSLTLASDNKYSFGNRNAGFYYRELSVQKVWEKLITGEEIDAGTSLSYTITGTSLGTDGTNNYTYENTYVLEQAANATGATKGLVTATCTDAESSLDFEGIMVYGENTVSSSNSIPSGYTAIPSLTVSSEDDTDTGLSTVTWTLETIALQAKDNYGEITYDLTDVTETETVDNGTGGTTTRSLTGFVTETSCTEVQSSLTSASVITAKAVNTQVLYNLNLYKISENSTATDTLFLAGAEFTLYDDLTCDDDDIVTLVTDSATDISGSAGSYSSGTAKINDSSYGLLSIGSLAAGTYYLKETAAPDGYLLNNSIWKIEITYEEANPTIPVITVTQVVDKDGYEIAIASQSSFTIDSNNTTTGTLSTYYVEDESGNTTSFDGTALTYTISFEMENYISYELPESGGSGSIWYMTVGIMLILLAVWMMIVRRKKSRG